MNDDDDDFEEAENEYDSDILSELGRNLGDSFQQVYGDLTNQINTHSDVIVNNNNTNDNNNNNNNNDTNNNDTNNNLQNMVTNIQNMQKMEN